MRPVFFVHVRRTASATVRKAFEDAVAPELHFPPTGNCKMTDDLWEQAKNYPYVYGHFWMYQWLPFNLPHRFMTVMREPVDQQVAVWHNYRYRVDVLKQDLDERYSLPVMTNLADSIENGSIKRLFDRTLLHVTSDLKNPLESAKANLEKMLVGFFDDVESFVRRAMGYAQLPVPRMIEPRHLNAMVEPLDPHLRKKMESYLEPDCELYAWAKQTLSS